MQLLVNIYGYNSYAKQLTAAEMLEKLRNFTIISKKVVSKGRTSLGVKINAIFGLSVKNDLKRVYTENKQEKDGFASRLRRKVGYPSVMPGIFVIALTLISAF